MQSLQIDTSVIDDIRTRDYRRFLAIQRAPASCRNALYAITAFYNELAHIPESVSEPMLAAIRFSWWRESIEAITAGEQAKAHPVIHAIEGLLKTGQITPDELYALIAERDADLDNSLLTDEPRFLCYLDETSGALHRIWARIIGTPVEEEAIIALSRGSAMVGLVISIPHYAREGALKFPTSMLVAHELEPSAQSLAAPSDELRMLAHYLHGKAAMCLTHASHFKKQMPAPHRVLLALATYDAMRLKNAAYDPYHPSLAMRSVLPWVWRAIRA